MLNVVLNAELGECGARMWNCMAFNQLLWYILIFIISVPGNLTVRMVICKGGSRLLYKVPFNKYLLILAVADLMVSLLAIPIYILSTDHFNHPSGTAGIILCKTVTGYFFLFWMATVSVFTLVAISCERLRASNKPFECR